MARNIKAKLKEPALGSAVAKAIRERREARFPDGSGLTLVVTAAGNAKWVHRYSFRGRYPERWLGSYPHELSLADARLVRNADLELIASGKNPVDVHAEGATVTPTFAEYCRQYFHRLAPPEDRKHPMERSQWYRDMTQRIGHISKMRVDDVRPSDVLQVVRPHWDGQRCPPATARVVRAIARVMDFRAALENVDADPNASVWNRTLMSRLKKHLGDEVHHTVNQKSLSYTEARAVFDALRAMPMMSTRCLEFLMLSGVRVQEATGAKWGEIDWKGRTWTVPASRRKSHKNKGPAGKPFVVPLSLAMVQCLRRARENRVTDLGPDDFIFPSYGSEHSATRKRPAGVVAKPYHPRSILDQTQKFGAITTHGFRATITAWGVAIPHRARPEFTLELMDRVLSHTVRNKDEERLSKALVNYVNDAGRDPFVPRRKVVLREWSAYLRGRAEPPVKTSAEPVPAPASDERPALRLAA